MDANNTYSNCTEEFTHHQRALILSVLASISAVSLAMNIIVLSVAMYLKLYRTLPHRLAMYLVLCSIPTNIVHISQLGSLEYPNACKAIGAIRQYFFSVELLFTVCFTFYLFCWGVLNHDLKYLEIVYIILPICAPLLVIWIPYVGPDNSAYGITVAWCGIRSLKPCSMDIDPFGLGMQFGIWYAPLFILQNLNAFAIISVITALFCRSRHCCMKRNGDGEQDQLIQKKELDKNKKAIKELLPLMVYLIIFYILTLVPVAHRLYLVKVKHGSFTFALMHVISNGLWGFNCSTMQLIHIYVNRRQASKKTARESHGNNSVPAVNDEQQRYTRFTEASSEGRSVVQSFPKESEVDADYLKQLRVNQSN